MLVERDSPRNKDSNSSTPFQVTNPILIQPLDQKIGQATQESLSSETLPSSYSLKGPKNENPHEVKAGIPKSRPLAEEGWQSGSQQSIALIQEQERKRAESLKSRYAHSEDKDRRERSASLETQRTRTISNSAGNSSTFSTHFTSNSRSSLNCSSSSRSNGSYQVSEGESVVYQLPKIMQECHDWMIDGYMSGDAKKTVSAEESVNMAHRTRILEEMPKPTVEKIRLGVLAYCLDVVRNEFQVPNFSLKDFGAFEVEREKALEYMLGGIVLKDILARLRAVCLGRASSRIEWLITELTATNDLPKNCGVQSGKYIRIPSFLDVLKKHHINDPDKKIKKSSTEEIILLAIGGSAAEAADIIKELENWDKDCSSITSICNSIAQICDKISIYFTDTCSGSFFGHKCVFEESFSNNQKALSDTLKNNSDLPRIDFGKITEHIIGRLYPKLPFQNNGIGEEEKEGYFIHPPQNYFECKDYPEKSSKSTHKDHQDQLEIIYLKKKHPAQKVATLTYEWLIKPEYCMLSFKNYAFQMGQEDHFVPLMEIIAKLVKIPPNTVVLDGLLVSTLKYPMSSSLNPVRRRKSSSNSDPISRMPPIIPSILQPQEIFPKKMVAKPIRLDDPNFKMIQQSLADSPIQSGSGNRSPMKLSPHYQLPNEILQKYNSYLKEICITPTKVNINKYSGLDISKYGEPDNQKLFDARFIAKLKEKLGGDDYKHLGQDTLSNLIQLDVLAFCQDAIWISFVQTGLTEKQYNENKDSFVSALFKLIQDRGILLKNILPRLIHFKNDVAEYLHDKKRSTMFTSELYNHLCSLTSIDEFPDHKEGTVYEKNLNVFLSVFDVLLPEKMSHQSNNFSSRFKGLMSNMSPTTELILTAIGGTKFEGQNIIEIIRSYGGPIKREEGSIFEVLKEDCHTIAKLCCPGSKILLRDHVCRVEHYFVKEYLLPKPLMTTCSEVSEISSQNLAFKTLINSDGQNPKKTHRSPKVSPLQSSKRFSSFSSSSHSESETPKKSDSFLRPRSNSQVKSFSDSEGSSPHVNRTPVKLDSCLFEKLSKFRQPFTLDVKGDEVFRSSYEANPIMDSCTSLKYDALPQIITVNGVVFYAKSLDIVPLSSKLKHRSKNFNFYSPVKENVKKYGIPIEFWVDFIVCLYSSGLDKHVYDGKVSEGILSSIAKMENPEKGKVQRDEQIMRISDNVRRFLNYGSDEILIMKEANQLHPPDFTSSKWFPYLRVTELMSDPCTIRAIIYMSLLFPEFFPQQSGETSDYIIPYDKDHVKESLEFHINISNMETFEVCHLNEIKIYRTAKQDEVVATIIYSWKNLPLSKDNPKGWESIFTIEDCKVLNPMEWARIMSKLTKPNYINAHNDMPGVLFSTRFR